MIRVDSSLIRVDSSIVHRLVGKRKIWLVKEKGQSSNDNHPLSRSMETKRLYNSKSPIIALASLVLNCFELNEIPLVLIPTLFHIISLVKL